MTSTAPSSGSARASSSGEPEAVRKDADRSRSATSRPAAAIALSYMVVTLPFALRVLTASGVPAAIGGGATRARAWLVVITHLAIVVALAWVTWRASVRDGHVSRANTLTTRVVRVLEDWSALIFISFLYAELPWLMAAYRNGQPTLYHDAWVQRAELALFGSQPSHALAGALPFAWLSEALHLGYLTYYLIIYLPPLLLYVGRGDGLGARREAFAWSTAALMLAFTSCFLVFVLYPVEGPRYAWAPPPGVPDGPVRRMALWVLSEGSSRGAAFPSSHAAVSVAQTLTLWRVGARRMSGVVGVLTALLVVGAVYGGFHYAVDMLAGVAVGLTCSVTALAFARRASDVSRG